MPAPVASGWSGRRAGLVPAGKAPPCHGARGNQTFAPRFLGDLSDCSANAGTAVKILISATPEGAGVAEPSLMEIRPAAR